MAPARGSGAARDTLEAQLKKRPIFKAPRRAESFYGKYDVEGTLDRTGGQSYAKLRLHKLKKLKPWYYEHCYVCGSDEKTDGDLLLCDGQDGRSPAPHAIDATLFPWSRRLDGVEAHKG